MIQAKSHHGGGSDEHFSNKVMMGTNEVAFDSDCHNLPDEDQIDHAFKASDSNNNGAYLRSQPNHGPYHERTYIGNFLMRFKILKAIQVALAIYICVMTYSYLGGLQDPNTKLIIDPTSQERTNKGLILFNGKERALVGATRFQVFSIGISRASAFFMYPGNLLLSDLTCDSRHSLTGLWS